MPHPEISTLAASLRITLDPVDAPTKDALLSAINRELKDLQIPELTAAQHERQIALTQARGKILADGRISPNSSTDLVPISLITQVIDAIQKNVAPASTGAPARPDPVMAMRTNVKAATAKASTDFTRKRSLPFAGAGALIASAYGLKTYVNVEDLKWSSDFFYPLFWLSVAAIVIGYSISWMAQRRADRMLRGFYNPDLQESALERIFTYKITFPDDRHPVIWHPEHEEREGDDLRIVTRAEFRMHLSHLAAIGSSPRIHFWPRILDRYANHALGMITTIDLDAALDDATDLALDRLIELGIIESVVVGRRQSFRLIQ